MLTDYGIQNAGTRIEDGENDLSRIGCPFVAQSGGDFVVVCKVETGETGKTAGKQRKSVSLKILGWI